MSYMVRGNDPIGAPFAFFLAQLGFDVKASKRNRARTHAVTDLGHRMLDEPAKAMCLGDDAAADHECTGSRFLKYRICLPRPIVECL